MEKPEPYKLSLFISGTSTNSVKAINNIKLICEAYLHENYTLEIIDIYQQPEMARKEQIIAIPTLIKREPAPYKRIIGDLSNRTSILRDLGIPDENL